MGQLKAPKDILGLGKHLVHELGFEHEHGNDTLGRWMAHHLSELIIAAENDPSAAMRSKARKEAVQTIIKIWEHRADLPGNAYPLAPYKHVLQILDRLRPAENPFLFLNHYGDSRIEQLCANLFDSFTRLIISLLFMEVTPSDRSAKVNMIAVNALDEAELQVRTAIAQWGELLQVEDKHASQKRRKKTEESSAHPVNFEEIAISLTEQIAPTLAELQSELKKVQ